MKITHILKESTDKDWKGCLMLTMPDIVGEMINDLEIPADKLTADGREDYTHLTVLYGFSQDTKFEDVVEFITTETENPYLNLALGKIKRFKADDNRPDSDVLVIEVDECEDIRDLNSALKDEFGVVSNYKDYNPHITIAYVTPGALEELDGDAAFEGMMIEANQMTYSTGSSESRTRKVIPFGEFK